jgi:hypothetical protein
VDLIVGPARTDDVFKDIVRINHHDRENVPAGRICKISICNRSRFLIARGLPESQRGKILLDDLAREALEVKVGSKYDFQINRVGLWGQLRWACSVSDPGARIAAWLGVLSLLLGLLGLAIGIWSIWPNSKA